MCNNFYDEERTSHCGRHFVNQLFPRCWHHRGQHTLWIAVECEKINAFRFGHRQSSCLGENGLWGCVSSKWKVREKQIRGPKSRCENWFHLFGRWKLDRWKMRVKKWVGSMEKVFFSNLEWKRIENVIKISFSNFDLHCCKSRPDAHTTFCFPFNCFQNTSIWL